jgi:hypothetical protein
MIHEPAMLEVHFPTVDSGTLVSSRYTHPDPDNKLLQRRVNAAGKRHWVKPGRSGIGKKSGGRSRKS